LQSDAGLALAAAARSLLADLERGQAIDAHALRTAMTAAFNGSDAEGAWTWKTAYDVPTSHPADAARMTVIVSALGKLGFAAEAAEVELRWSELMTRMETDPPPEFYRCYPDALLDVCVTEALAATREIGCDLASPDSGGQVRVILNDAWKVMWRDPAAYLDWEQRAVVDLHAGLKTHAQRLVIR
jgi:hypothetical protein